MGDAGRDGRDEVGVRFEVLSGLLRVSVDGDPVTISSPLQQALLGELLAADGACVTRGELIVRLWPQGPPAGADNVLSTHASRLRRTLDPHRRGGSFLPRSTGGYRIELGDASYDLGRLRQVRRAQDAGDDLDLTEVCGLLIRLASTAVDETVGPLLEEGWQLARDAVSEIVDSSPDADTWVLLEPHLRVAVERAPYDERVASWWLLALHSTGRGAEALVAHQKIVRRLREDLGADPGPDLSRTQVILLGAEPTDPATAVTVSAPTSAARTPTPANLPIPPPGFAGRDTEVEQLLRLAERAAPAPGPRIVVITGPVGIGKSAVAAVVAHRLGHQFPDGQMTVDFSTADPTAAPGAPVTSMLVQLGEAESELQPTAAGRLDQLRAATGNRAQLLLLDNVRPEDRLTDLVPHAPNSLVLVTCRSLNHDLIGYDRVDLAPLQDRAALAMLAGMLPARSWAADDAGVAELLTRCEGHPVALRVCAHLLAVHPAWGVPRLAENLRSEQWRATVLGGVGHGVDSLVSEAISALPTPAGEACAAAGFLGLATIEPWMVAALVDVDEASARQALETVEEARLLDDTGGSRPRFAMGSLVRTVAGQLWHERGAPESQAAMGRLVQLMITVLTPATPAGRDTATSRAVAELPESAYVSLVTLAVRHGLDREASELTRTLGETVFAERNLFDAWRSTHARALSLAGDDGTGPETARLALGLARLHLARDEFALAGERLDQAAAVLDGSDPPTAPPGHAGSVTSQQVVLQRGVLAAEQHRCRQGIAVLTQLLDTAASTPVAAEALRQRAACHRDLGDVSSARADGQRALELARQGGDPLAIGLGLRSEALTHRAVGAYAEALRLSSAAREQLAEAGAHLLVPYAVQSVAKARLRLTTSQGGIPEVDPDLRAALDACRAHHDRFGQALVLRTLGEEALARGDGAGAEDALRLSLAIWERLELPGWRARTQRSLADAMTLTGDLDAAHRWRVEALAGFVRLDLREAAEMSVVLAVP